MPDYEIKILRRPELKGVAFSDEQMRSFGEEAIGAIRDRAALAQDIYDQPAKPLTPAYAAQKRKAGKAEVRDLRLTGNMLGSLGIVENGADHVKVTVRGATPFRKGIFNQNVDPWFGLSPNDEERVMSKIRAVFGENVVKAISE